MSAGAVDRRAVARDLAALTPDRIVLVDVGAAEGTQARWRTIEDRLLLIGFEPDQRSMADLPPGVERRYLSVGLWDEAGRRTLNLARKPMCTSVFEPELELLERYPERERWEITGTVEIEVDTLDHALAEAELPRPDFIKADIQGAELAALRGAAGTLAAGVFGVEIEIEFLPVYRDQPLFSDLDLFLREQGFELIDLRRTWWKRERFVDAAGARGQLSVGDALYLRGPEAFLPIVRAMEAPEGLRSAMAALTICGLYGLHDIGLELAHALAAEGVLDDEQAAAAIAVLDRRPRYRVERFPERMQPRMASGGRVLRRLARRLERAADRWSPDVWPPNPKRRGRAGDGDLGNP